MRRRQSDHLLKSTKRSVRCCVTKCYLIYCLIGFTLPGECTYLCIYVYMYICIYVPYSRKYWRSIKFGGLAVGEATVKFKSVKFKCNLRTYVLSYACACARILYVRNYRQI